MTTTSDDLTLEKSIPRIALLLTDPRASMEIQEILRQEYSSLMLISEMEKLREFDLPLIVLVDNIQDAANIRSMKSSEEARIIIISDDADSELIGAAFDAGADEYVCYPFSSQEVLQKTKHILGNIIS